MMFRAFFFLLFLVCAVAIPASPEPEVDPLGGPQMYAVAAGRRKYRSKVPPIVLKNGDTICPKDYKRGFSILCDIPGKRVKFYVNGKLEKIERKVPFYIKGNFKKVVVPWRSYPTRAIIKCKSRLAYIIRAVKIAC